MAHDYCWYVDMIYASLDKWYGYNFKTLQEYMG